MDRGLLRISAALTLDGVRGSKLPCAFPLHVLVVGHGTSSA